VPSQISIPSFKLLPQVIGLSEPPPKLVNLISGVAPAPVYAANPTLPPAVTEVSVTVVLATQEPPEAL